MKNWGIFLFISFLFSSTLFAQNPNLQDKITSKNSVSIPEKVPSREIAPIKTSAKLEELSEDSDPVLLDLDLTFHLLEENLKRIRRVWT